MEDLQTFNPQRILTALAVFLELLPVAAPAPVVAATPAPAETAAAAPESIGVVKPAA